MTKDGYTPKSISRKINSTRTFYRFFKVNGYITDDPSLLVAHPKYQLAPPRILTPTEYRALRDAARNDVRMSAIIELLLQTGIRIGELASLKVSDVKENALHIEPYEKHAERDVPFNKRAQEALEKYMKTRPATQDQHLFVTKSGRPFLVRNIRTSMERYFRLAEIKGAKVNDQAHICRASQTGCVSILLSKFSGSKAIHNRSDFVGERKRNSHSYRPLTAFLSAQNSRRIYIFGKYFPHPFFYSFEIIKLTIVKSKRFYLLFKSFEMYQMYRF